MTGSGDRFLNVWNIKDLSLVQTIHTNHCVNALISINPYEVVSGGFYKNEIAIFN